MEKLVETDAWGAAVVAAEPDWDWDWVWVFLLDDWAFDDWALVD
jgi:hypothetical protein